MEKLDTSESLGYELFLNLLLTEIFICISRSREHHVLPQTHPPQSILAHGTLKKELTEETPPVNNKSNVK
jgi:hypothetical protein